MASNQNRFLSPEAFTKAMIQSSLYKTRLANAGYANPTLEAQIRLRNISNIKTNYIDSGVKGFEGYPGSRADPGLIILDRAQSRNTKTPLDILWEHEYGHQEQGLDFMKGGSRLNSKDRNNIAKHLLPGTDVLYEGYGTKPSEVKSELNALRYELYKKGVPVLNRNLNAQDINTLNNRNSSYSYKRMKTLFGDKNILHLLNTVADNNQSNNDAPIAAYGGVVNPNINMKKKYALGGNTPQPNIEAEGGEVIQTPDGQSFNINGPSHEQGGVPMNAPGGSLIFSDRIGFKDSKGNYKTLADRKKLRDALMKKIGDTKGNFLTKNTADRTKAKAEQEEMNDVILQSFIRKMAGEGHSKLRIPKAALGAGDYITMGSNVLGPIIGLINTNSMTKNTQQMPNFNKNWGTPAINTLRSANENLKTEKQAAVSALNQTFNQQRQDAAARIDNEGGSINLRRALRSDEDRAINAEYSKSINVLEGQMMSKQNENTDRLSQMLADRDTKIAEGNKDAFEYNQALSRQNAIDNAKATQQLVTGIGNIGESLNNSKRNNVTNNMIKSALSINAASTGNQVVWDDNGNATLAKIPSTDSTTSGESSASYDMPLNMIGASRYVPWNDPSELGLPSATLPSYDSGYFGSYFKRFSLPTFAAGGVVPDANGTMHYMPATNNETNDNSDILNILKSIGIDKPLEFTTPATEDTKTEKSDETSGTNSNSNSNSNSDSNYASLYVKSGNVDKILAAIKKTESGGNYTTPNKSGKSTASGAYQFLNGTWRALTKKYGIGTEYTRAMHAPPAVQDAIARRYVQDILKKNNNNVNSVFNTWYTGNARGVLSRKGLAANNGLTASSYLRKALRNSKV